MIIEDGLEEAICKTSCPLQVGKLRIKKVPGQKHDVNFTLSDSICAPVAGLNEFDKNALVSWIEKKMIHRIQDLFSVILSR